MLGNIFNLAYEMLLRVFVNKKTSSYCSLQPLFVINDWNHGNLMKFWCIIITFAPKCLFLNFRNELISIFCKYVCKKVDFLTKTIFQCIWNSGLWCFEKLFITAHIHFMNCGWVLIYMLLGFNGENLPNNPTWKLGICR